MKTKDEVILVDENDKQTGIAEKMLAHQKGWLHRAFSVFIVEFIQDDWYILLQQRDKNKYHCAGLWTNTCCSHPSPNENTADAALRRLQQEMGITSQLTEVGVFEYRAEFTNGLTEHEIDHVFIGTTAQDHFEVNPEEVENFRWDSIANIELDWQQHPEQYTPWFKQALDIVKLKLSGKNKWKP